LQKHRKQLVPKDIDNLKTLIVKKSWWETVDTIDAFVGDIVMMDKALKRQGILLRIWYKRIK
jgi:3-methyladenine DNA glycosylase AlkD